MPPHAGELRESAADDPQPAERAHADGDVAATGATAAAQPLAEPLSVPDQPSGAPAAQRHHATD